MALGCRHQYTSFHGGSILAEIFRNANSDAGIDGNKSKGLAAANVLNQWKYPTIQRAFLSEF
jgi:hypothetical protein